MRTFSSSEILDLYERGARLHPLDQGLLALSVGVSSPLEELADWRLGRRNRALCELHCLCFGSRVRGWTSCTSCEEKVEFELNAGAVVQAMGEPGLDEFLVVRGGRFRLPTSRDLAQIAQLGDVEPAAYRLAERCWEREGECPAFAAEALEEIGEEMAAADPMAEIRLAFRCPSCSREWEDSLDIGSFVWAEIQARAKRILWEIHTFASAYGWTETEILSLSAARRALYLQMVQA